MLSTFFRPQGLLLNYIHNIQDENKHKACFCTGSWYHQIICKHDIKYFLHDTAFLVDEFYQSGEGILDAKTSQWGKITLILFPMQVHV